MLHEITAVIRPRRWKPTAAALIAAGFPALTRQRVFGRGRQRGLRYAAQTGEKAPAGIAAIPKWMLTLVVEDERVDAALDAILTANRSGMIGDGKVFVCPLGRVLRFSDGAEDREALATAAPGPEAEEAGAAWA